jgi:pimeloyl-ACP methyl ester carboxylesterase
LAEGEAGTIRGLEGLHAAGYRRVIVAGFSRGAFIGMAALARPDLVEAVVLLSPAAHGTRAERKAQALADFGARLAAARGPMRLALAQFEDDPFDPDPVARGRMAREGAERAGIALMLIDRPALPTGHMGSFEPEFDAVFGVELARFVTGVE